MSKKQFGIWLTKAIVFLLIGGLLFTLCNSLFLEKSSYGKYRAWKALDNVDVLILGNSHADTGLRAQSISEALEQEYGRKFTVFNYSIYGMRMEQAYFFVKEILKDHTPDLIVLETFAFCPLADEHREILARRAFDVFPLSLNKIKAIQYCVKEEDLSSYYIPFMKYHTRWKELTSDDLGLLYDKDLWPAYGGNGMFGTQTCADPGDGWFDQVPPDDLMEPTPSEQECLDWFLALLEEEDIPLLFLSIPYKYQMGMDSISQIKVNNYLREHYVNGTTVQMLDLNRMWGQLDFGYADLGDEGHANFSGANKISNTTFVYLKNHYDMPAMAAAERR